MGEEKRPPPGARPPRPTITLPTRKTAKAQIRAMASTAIEPTNEEWNFRRVFNPGLPLDHAQQHMGDLGNKAEEKNTPNPLILPLMPQESAESPPWEPLDYLANTESRTTLIANPLSQASDTNLSLMAEAINRAIEDEPGTSMAPGALPGHQPIDLNQDLYLTDSDTSSESMDVPTPLETNPPLASPSDSTLSSLTPPTRVTPGSLLDGHADSSPPQTLHEGVMRIGADLEQLVNLNKKVTPQDQLEVLWKIHHDLVDFMAPYRLYHG